MKHITRKVNLPRNVLLAALPRKEYIDLFPSLEQVSLHENQVLYEAGRPMKYAYFPEQSLISLFATLSDGKRFEIAVIVNRGFLGVSLALASRISTQLAIVQIAGSAVPMEAKAFRAAFKRGGAFQQIVLSYIKYHLLTVSQAAICNYFHQLRTRFARSLLTIHDQVGSVEFLLRPESLSRMLGVTRSEVANTVALFRRKGLIEYKQGKIKILDRKRLELIACECYRTIEATIPAKAAEHIDGDWISRRHRRRGFPALQALRINKPGLAGTPLEMPLLESQFPLVH